MTGVGALSALLFLSQLGKTGLVDETPPLFASAARGMVETGDWLTPRVNGQPRFDKPVLVYWLMGLGYGLLPKSLDPLGSLAARLPSALTGVVVSLALADLLWCYPQQPPLPQKPRGRTWLGPLAASLGFGLSPLVLIWSRTAVSDLLFTGLLSLALLGFWRHQARQSHHMLVGSWLALGFAVLTKGPVALALAGLTCLLFGCRQGQLGLLWRRLAPLKGLALVALVTMPWYGAELMVEGSAFWNSFFLYHNVERFTQVVNGHAGPLWFYGPVLLIGAMPQLPLALYGAWTSLAPNRNRSHISSPGSLGCFAACWLLAVVVFFTMATTKLPSYVLPAMAPIGLLVGLSASEWQVASAGRGPLSASAWSTIGQAGLVGIGLLTQALWLPHLHQLLPQALPDMPTLGVELQTTGVLGRIGLIWFLAALLAAVALQQRWWCWLLALQLTLVLWIPGGLLPLSTLVDRLRQEPVRAMATAIQYENRPGEPVAMVGFNKPSLHFYSKQLVQYEKRRPQGLANLASCGHWQSKADTMLVVLDQQTAEQPYWQDLQGTTLAQAEPYELRRIGRQHLETVVRELHKDGVVGELNCPSRNGGQQS